MELDLWALGDQVTPLNPFRSGVVGQQGRVEAEVLAWMKVMQPWLLLFGPRARFLTISESYMCRQ